MSILKNCFYFRDNPGGRHNTSTGSSRTSSRNYSSPLSVSPHLSPRGGGYNPSPGASSAGSALTPIYTTPFTPLDDYHFTVNEFGDARSPRKHTGNLDVHVVNQVKSISQNFAIPITTTGTSYNLIYLPLD